MGISVPWPQRRSRRFPGAVGLPACGAVDELIATVDLRHGLEIAAGSGCALVSPRRRDGVTLPALGIAPRGGLGVGGLLQCLGSLALIAAIHSAADPAADERAQRRASDGRDGLSVPASDLV